MIKNAFLIVDDDTLVLHSIQHQIKKHFGSKYRYETATDAMEAWAVIEELVEEGIEILIIISDWLMPNIKGDEFLRKVHEKFPTIKKFIISGQADEDSITALDKEIQLQAYIKKPWSESELITLINTALKDKSSTLL